MIVKVRKTNDKPQTIQITTSSDSDFTNVSSYRLSYNTIIGRKGYVYLVTNSFQEQVLERVNRLENTLPSINLKMCTGLIVDYRVKEELRNEYEDGACPLF